MPFPRSWDPLGWALAFDDDRSLTMAELQCLRMELGKKGKKFGGGKSTKEVPIWEKTVEQRSCHMN